MDVRTLCVITLLACAACDSDLGEPASGHSIRGEVTYEGSTAADFDHPFLLVTADTALGGGEDAPPPYALESFADIDLDEPVPFELRFLLPGRYFVIAIIGERDDFDPSASPVSAYPDACTLAQMPDSRSLELEDEDLEDIDIHILDNLTDDPCFTAGMPDAGQLGDAGDDGDAMMGDGTLGILEVNVTAPGLSAGPDDILRVSLFAEGPLVDPTPSYEEMVVGPNFPQTVRIEEVEPEDYTVIVCFQTADSTNERCMGPDDRLAFFPSLSEMVDVEAGTTTAIDVELP